MLDEHPMTNEELSNCPMHVFSKSHPICLHRIAAQKKVKMLHGNMLINCAQYSIGHNAKSAVRTFLVRNNEALLEVILHLQRTTKLLLFLPANVLIKH